MRARDRLTGEEQPRLMNIEQGRAYVGMGTTMFRQWAEEIGCVRKIGTRVFFDRKVIDEALDKMIEV